MPCTNCSSCELYAQFALHPALRVWQTHYCAGDYKRCVRFQLSIQKKVVPLNLLPNGATIAAARSEEAMGATAFFNAVMKNRVSMVDSLVKTGMDVNTRNGNGATALMVAVHSGHVDMVRALLARGADVTARDCKGHTAAEIAANAGHGEIVQVLQQHKGAAAPAPASAPAAKRAPADASSEMEETHGILAQLFSRLGLKRQPASSGGNV
jgi:ankyrin repeat protein